MNLYECILFSIFQIKSRRRWTGKIPMESYKFLWNILFPMKSCKFLHILFTNTKENFVNHILM